MQSEGGSLFVDRCAVLVRDVGHPRDYGTAVQGGRDETTADIIARCWYYYGDDGIILGCGSLQYGGWFDELGCGGAIVKNTLGRSDSE